MRDFPSVSMASLLQRPIRGNDKIYSDTEIISDESIQLRCNDARLDYTEEGHVFEIAASARNDLRRAKERISEAKSLYGIDIVKIQERERFLPVRKFPLAEFLPEGKWSYTSPKPPTTPPPQPAPSLWARIKNYFYGRRRK